MWVDDELIHKVVTDPRRRKRMILIAEDIAAQRGLCLYHVAKSIIKLPFEKKYIGTVFQYQNRK